MAKSIWQDEPLMAVGAEPGDDVSYRTDPTQDPYLIKQEAEFARLRRNRIAEGFAFALSGTGYLSREFSDLVASTLAKDAVGLADALIAELDK